MREGVDHIARGTGNHPVWSRETLHSDIRKVEAGRYQDQGNR